MTHAPDRKTARAVSRSVVCSNLFKAAVFGRDANWGRILCAIGYTPGDFSIDKVCVWLSSKAGEVYEMCIRDSPGAGHQPRAGSR